MQLTPSPFLYNPETLQNSLVQEIRDFVLKDKNYPCVAAVKSIEQNEYLTGVYAGFGTALHWRDIRRDLQFFIQQHSQSKSPYLSYWAIFNDNVLFSEEDFELRLWNELSHLASAESKDHDWKHHSDDPQNPGFSLCVDGEKFFIVGLHSQSSRYSRRFKKPALVFNLMKQFEDRKETEG